MYITKLEESKETHCTYPERKATKANLRQLNIISVTIYNEKQNWAESNVTHCTVDFSFIMCVCFSSSFNGVEVDGQ